MQLGVYHRYWGCNVIVVGCSRSFLIVDSCTRDDIENHGDEFRDSLLFSGSIYHISYVLYSVLPVIMRYSGDISYIRDLPSSG